MTGTRSRPGEVSGDGHPKLVAVAQEAAAALSDRAVHATQLSITITDPNLPDNPLVWVNPAFTATTGYSFNNVVGRNCRLLQGEHCDPTVIAEIRSNLATGRPFTTTVLNYRKDGTPFWNELSVSPMLDDRGRVSHFVGVQTDVSARVRVQRARDEALERAEVAAGRLALLAGFATRLAGSLENDDIVQVLADVLVPRLGTWCALHLNDDSGTGTRSVVRHARSTDPEIATLLDQIEASLGSGIPPDSPTARVLRGEQPYVLVPDVAAEPSAAGARGDERSIISAQLGVASLIVVPLRSRSRILGCAAVMADAEHAPYDETDLALAQQLASRAALMLENSVLYTRERTAAVTLQRSMMPAVPQLPGLTMAARYLTASDDAAVGGDWYDVFALRDGGVGLAVGDAMGHNVDSAAAMGKLSTMLRSYAWPGAQAGEVLTSIDALLAGTRLGYLATCCYGRLLRTGDGASFEYANAGHPPPILRLPDGTAGLLTGGHGAMLGVQPLLVDGSAVRTSATVDVPRGSTLIFYTDGLTDSLGDHLDPSDAVQRLIEIVAAASPDASPRRMVAALGEFAQGGRTDDVVIIAVRVD